MIDWNLAFEQSLPYDDFLSRHGKEAERAKWAAIHDRVALTGPQRWRGLSTAGGGRTAEQQALHHPLQREYRHAERDQRAQNRPHRQRNAGVARAEHQRPQQADRFAAGYGLEHRASFGWLGHSLTEERGATLTRRGPRQGDRV